ncbi:COG4705 family protein [Streptomyces sp. NBC_01022]|uniref:COG4705 family protein n=1 Tax=Streptomyces sp. NBC_01022 TaxID=2903723 RepID=UPI002DDACEE8|nr:hypothetical protein [Streptomyces sp. NBC_01022]WRZ85614.1 hypothetical protein OG316_37705 [Streptomyces sp. NBC_01022]
MTYETQQPPASDGGTARVRWNKVPEITAYFWVIKVLCTTVGETGADYLDGQLGMGLTGTSVVMSALLVVALIAQLRSSAYRPGIYWLVVVLVSIVGTLITDNLTDNLGVPLQTTTAVFAVALAAAFLIWFTTEGTLSIHRVDSVRREAFYWVAVLLTFALGTAVGDLLAEQLSLGYWVAALLFGLVIAAVALARYAMGLGAVLSFWTVYVLTRPLGASVGDFLSQPADEGGLALGTVITSVLFLVVILALVVFLAVSRRDVTEREQVVSRPAA